MQSVVRAESDMASVFQAQERPQTCYINKYVTEAASSSATFLLLFLATQPDKLLNLLYY